MIQEMINNIILDFKIWLFFGLPITLLSIVFYLIISKLKK